MQKLYIINYCNPNCIPLKSITSLPEAEAYAMAKELSRNKGNAFYRFADFENYYPKRIKSEKWLYEWFVNSGGEPLTPHPLYFVLNGSEFLFEWFDKGEITVLSLDKINTKHISFTFGDSRAILDKKDRKDPITKETLYNIINAYNGGIAEFMNEVNTKWRYIEAQLWNDSYCK